MSQHQFESTIRFIGFNAEEDGLLGSEDYVANHVIPGNETIVGMVNMDMILRPGSDVDPHQVIDAEVEAQAKHPPSVAWAKAFQQAAADYVSSLIVNDTIIETESSSDNDSFLIKAIRPSWSSRTPCRTSGTPTGPTTPSRMPRTDSPTTRAVQPA